MTEITCEMLSCHERVSSVDKQQSLNPHPMLCNCQGGNISLPQRHSVLWEVQRRQKHGTVGAIGFLLVGFGGRKKKGHCTSKGCFVTVAVATS